MHNKGNPCIVGLLAYYILVSLRIKKYTKIFYVIFFKSSVVDSGANDIELNIDDRNKILM